MQDSLSAYLAGMDCEGDRAALQPILFAIADRMSSQATSTAGLVIKSGGGVLAKIGAVAFQGIANGKPVTIAASTDMPALVGVITAASFNVFCFFIDSASVVTVAMGIEGTTLAKVKFPTFPQGKALVGYLIVTYASTFTGNSTALDTATTNYVSPVGSFDPTISLS
jgi:hypothetical protein